MCKIPLSGKNGKGKFTLVSPEDYPRFSKHRWSLRGNTSGNGGSKPYVVRWNGRGKQPEHMRMSREILGVKNPLVKVDHINGDTLDNRRENLRVATNQQNGWNRDGANKTNASTGILGIYRSGGTFRAHIMANGQRRSKRFRTLEEATEQRREWEEELWKGWRYQRETGEDQPPQTSIGKSSTDDTESSSENPN